MADYVCECESAPQLVSNVDGAPNCSECIPVRLALSNLSAGLKRALAERDAALRKVADLRGSLLASEESRRHALLALKDIRDSSASRGRRIDATRKILWEAPCGNASTAAGGWSYPACEQKCGGCDCWIGRAIAALEGKNPSPNEEETA